MQHGMLALFFMIGSANASEPYLDEFVCYYDDVKIDITEPECKGDVCECPQCDCDVCPTKTEVSSDWLTNITGEGREIVLGTAEWCAPCQPVKKKLALFKSSIVLLDVDKNKDEAEKYHIGAIPALVLLQDGKFVKSVSGADNVLLMAKKWIEGEVAGETATLPIKVSQSISTCLSGNCSGNQYKEIFSPTGEYQGYIRQKPAYSVPRCTSGHCNLR